VSQVFEYVPTVACHSTKWEVVMPRRTQRHIWARSRGGISAGDWRLLVALRPIASRPVVDLLIGDADAIALARVPV
jgi:hypothetical protein